MDPAIFMEALFALLMVCMWLWLIIATARRLTGREG